MSNKGLKAKDAMTSDDFDLHYQKSYAQNVQTDYHYHDFHEIFVFLHGEVEFNIEGRNYNLNPGNILLISYHDLHQALPKGPNYYERFYCWLTPLFCKKHSTDKTNLGLCFSKVNKKRSRIIPTSLEQISKYFPLFVNFMKSDKYGSDIHLKALFFDFLVFVNEECITLEEELSLENVNENQQVIQIIDYIADNIDQSLTLEILSKYFFISKGHLNREFKNATGFTIHKYILKRRMLLSKSLLIQGYSVNEVYLLCGFNNYTHFIKTFKKEFDLSPKQFQLLNK